MTVNIGSFIGKTVVKDIRIELGVDKVPYFSAAAAFIAFLIVILFYHPKREGESERPSIVETLMGLVTALTRLRFLALILITAGFWVIQGQLYASMPKYVLRLVGEGAAPEWYANINPLVVVIFVAAITQMVRRWKPEASIAVAMLLIPLSALTMALSHVFDSNLDIFGLSVHPITAMMVIGISIQGLAECFLSPKYLEFASKQAPRGKEGLYLGFAHLNTFFAWLFGFVFAGYLLQAFCPDPKTLSAAEQAQRLTALEGQGAMPAAYANAHYLWYAFAGVGLISFVALVLFILVTRAVDARRANQTET
jgi:hypothetical protein